MPRKRTEQFPFMGTRGDRMFSSCCHRPSKKSPSVKTWEFILWEAKQNKTNKLIHKIFCLVSGEGSYREFCYFWSISRG